LSGRLNPRAASRSRIDAGIMARLAGKCINPG
jgi:hypothetical protein